MFPRRNSATRASYQSTIMRDHVRILGWCFIVYSAIIVLVGFGIGSIVLAIIAALRASDGVLYRYPLTIRLVK